MLIPRNVARGTLASMLLLALALAPAPASALQPPDADLPDPAGVVEAFQRVRAWVRDFDVPEPEHPDARLAIGNAPAACVILRRDGQVIGVGEDSSGDELMVRRAAGRALARVLSHPALARLTERLREGDAAGLGVEDLRRDLGPTLTLEVEVAGPFRPMLGRSYEQVAHQVEPGLDGVAMRRGDDWAVLFPARLRASNRSADIAAALPVLATELGLATAPLDELVRQHDVALYRFRTIDLAQAAPNRRPFEAYRGDAVVALDEVTPEAVVALADGIAARLCGTLWPAKAPEWVEGTYEKPPGVMGDYHPVADMYEPATAPPLAQALVSFALSIYAHSPGVDPDIAARADDAAASILRELDDWTTREPEHLADSDLAAAIVYAIHARPPADLLADTHLHDLRARAATALLADSGDEDVRARDPHARALAAGGLARLLRFGADADPAPDPALVRRQIDLAWRTPISQHVGLLPWIAWAEADYAAATGAPLTNGGAVRRIREMLHASQVGTDLLPGPEDLHGGFALRRSEATRADAQGTRPLVALGWMLRQPDLTPDGDRLLALDRQRRGLRFLIQLTARDGTLWAYPNADRVRGGVRAAAWNADQPVLAQAMGLLASCEAIRGRETPDR